MLVLICFALAVLAVTLSRAIEKVTPENVVPALRLGLAALVILVLTFTAMLIAPPEEAAQLLNSALKTFTKI